jgi:hypothetical protein
MGTQKASFAVAPVFAGRDFSGSCGPDAARILCAEVKA